VIDLMTALKRSLAQETSQAERKPKDDHKGSATRKPAAAGRRQGNAEVSRISSKAQRDTSSSPQGLSLPR
jgi:hypothetical protein